LEKKIIKVFYPRLILLSASIEGDVPQENVLSTVRKSCLL